MLYATTLVWLGRRAAAREHLDRAGNFIDDPVLADRLGVAHAARGELETAERIFRRVLAGDPEHTRARAHLARVLRSQGRSAEAAGLE